MFDAIWISLQRKNKFASCRFVCRIHSTTVVPIIFLIVFAVFNNLQLWFGKMTESLKLLKLNHGYLSNLKSTFATSLKNDTSLALKRLIILEYLNSNYQISPSLFFKKVKEILSVCINLFVYRVLRMGFLTSIRAIVPICGLYIKFL